MDRHDDVIIQDFFSEKCHNHKRLCIIQQFSFRKDLGIRRKKGVLSFAESGFGKCQEL
jgi:hypothetical protein